MQDSKNRQKFAIWAPSHNFATKACYQQLEKKLVKRQYLSPPRPHNMVNFSPLVAEIHWGVWVTPANFNGFRILAVLLHSILVVGISQTAALNRGHHLYFGRAAITLGIGPHSSPYSLSYLYSVLHPSIY